MTLIERELSLNEMLATPVPDLIAGRDATAITLLRTTLDELQVDVINLFPPVDQAFWSFDVFAAEDHAWRELARTVAPTACKIIDAELRRQNAERRSIVAYEMLGAVTKGFGDRYFPYGTPDTPVPYWWFAQRHCYLVAPTDRYDQVVRYFAEQQAQIGHECLRPADDSRVLVDMSQFDDVADYRYLSRYVTRLTEVERKEALKVLANDDCLDALAAGVLEIVGCREGPNLALLHDPDAFEDGDCIRAILRRRGELALRFVTLPNIERQRKRLADEQWHWALKDRDAVLQAFDERLARYPVIATCIE